MAEIDDDTLATMQRGMALLQKLSNDPRTRGQLEAAVKVHFPEVVTTDDIAERYAAPVRKEVDELKKTLQDRLDALDARDRSATEAEEMRGLETSFAQLRKEGYTDDGIEKIKGLMVDRKIPDPIAAAALFDRQNPPPPPEQASYEPSHWNYESNSVVDTDALFADPDKWESQQIAKVLQEERTPKRGEV